MTLLGTPPPPDVLDVDAGVIEEARRRQWRYRGFAAAVILAVAGIAAILVASLGGGGVSIADSNPVIPGPQSSLTFKDGLAYENGQPIQVGIEPSLRAGQVALDVREADNGSGGGSYPSTEDPLFGPDFPDVVSGNRVGSFGAIDVLLTGPTVASIHVKSIGTIDPVRLVGLPPEEHAFVFFRPAGSLGTVLPPDFKGDVLTETERRSILPVTLYDAAGHVVPVRSKPGYAGVPFHVPTADWQTPATAAPRGRCAVRSTLRGGGAQSGQAATVIRSDPAVSGPAFLSCLHASYRWHGSSFEVGLLVNAQSPGSAPAPLWNATSTPGHAGVVEVKPVREVTTIRIQRVPSQLSPAFIAYLTEKFGKAGAAQREKGYERAAREQNRHVGQLRTIRTTTLAFAAVARKVGPAWLVVRGGASLSQRIRFLDSLRITRLDLGHA